MAEGDRRSIRYLYDRVIHEARRLSGLAPAEKKSISTLLREEKPKIRLMDGGSHLLDREELRDFASRIPWFMRGLVRLPIVLVYRREGGIGRYRVDGDVWAARAISAILTGRYWEEKWELSTEEAEELIKRYKTLIMVTIRIELGSILGEVEEL